MTRFDRSALALAVGLVALVAVFIARSASAPAPSTTVIDGRGEIRTERRGVHDFTEVEVRHGIRLELAVGEPGSIEITTEANLLPIVTTVTAGARLTLDATADYTSGAGITARVRVPRLTALRLAGGASARAEAVRATTLDVSSNGGTRLSLSGQANALTLTVRGGGDFDLGEFTAANATFDLAGGVKATVAVTGLARGSAVGGVVLTLGGGTRTIDVRTSAGAVVRAA